MLLSGRLEQMLTTCMPYTLSQIKDLIRGAGHHEDTTVKHLLGATAVILPNKQLTAGTWPAGPKPRCRPQPATC